VVLKTESDGPKLLRRWNRTLRFQDGSAVFHHIDPKDHYRSIYFEVIDTVTGHMSKRIDEKGIQVNAAIELLISKAWMGDALPDASLKLIMDHFGEDLDEVRLRSQLHVLENMCEDEEVGIGKAFMILHNCGKPYLL